MDVAKTLKKPQNLMELKTYVSYMKDKSGITGWTDRQELLPVSENVLSCIMELLAYSKSFLTRHRFFYSWKVEWKRKIAL